MAKKQSGPKLLKATQVIAIAHPDGGTGLVMVEASGAIYIRTDDGWEALNMTEAPQHDN